MSSANLARTSRHLALWLLVPPALAVLGGIITLYLVWRYPDQALAVEPVALVTNDQGEHQHVINSVTPPLR
ncbi:MAG: hypothetical protein AB7F79_05010 [Steroidobacteraceae bacterium]